MTAQSVKSKTPAARGLFFWCACFLVAALSACDASRNSRAAAFAQVRTGIDGSTRDEVIRELGAPEVQWQYELLGVSTEKLAFPNERETYFIFFVNRKAFGKSAITKEQ